MLARPLSPSAATDVCDAFRQHPRWQIIGFPPDSRNFHDAFWPELSTTLSMKIGSAATLAEVSPQHFKQLCGLAKLGWPMARERIKTVCRQILDATRDPQVLPELRDATVREIVTKRAERMLNLMEKTAG